MPEISIVTPAYMANDQHIEWLTESIKSVQAQTFTGWEMIIVDDASPVPLAGATEGQIRLLRHDRRRGAGAARNTGAAAATAPYLLFLDADDKLKLDGLQHLWAARCPTGVVYGDLEYFGDMVGHHRLPDWSLELLMRGASPLAITALHPRAAWRTVGGFDESLPGLEDVDYWIKLAERHYCGRRIEQTIFDYRRHPNSRQAGLEANNRARMNQVLEVIRSRYRKVASDMAGVIKGCSKCPGSSGPGNGVERMVPPQVGDQTVRVRYTGRMEGSFTAHGFATGAKYFINGRGDTIVVDVRDVPPLLARHSGGVPEFERLADLVASTPEFAVAKVAGQALEDPPSNLVHLGGLNAKDAIALVKTTHDLPDLAVWLAEERASEKPRNTVIEALEAQIAAEQGAVS